MGGSDVDALALHLHGKTMDRVRICGRCKGNERGCNVLLQPFAWNDARDLLFWRIYEIRRVRRGVRRLIRGGHA
ncbi:hypothetical protein GNZ24_24990 [Burkholderia thailandensis]|nr:hypothetical protein [Burkholderia thailandensis]MUV30192.1 hypothetical protein [Burkholderia thailandensis]NBC92788.1 hypothetical protein [Burkholderia thailandensis]NBD05508.1 hypothetical protein [Burkholderia thailandensis]NBJ20300.1 hypothetical protein [Burkholderia thailandensis]